MRWRWLALCAVIACGDNLPDPAEARSGERLKLGWYEYPDGTRQRATSWYFDSELGERCTPSAWSDGNRYCAPPTDEAVYVTDECRRALGRSPIGQPLAPFLATTFHLHGERLASRVFRRLGSTLAPVSIWQKHESGCIGPLPPEEGFEYYELGDEVTPLPRLHRSTPRGDGALAVIDETSDDGLHVPIAFYDRTLGVECTPAPATGREQVECVPSDAAVASYFHDAGCTEPIVASGAGVPSTAIERAASTRCSHYYAVGSETAAPPLYESVGGACVQVAPPGGSRFFTMAEPRTLPELVRTRVATSRRLATVELVHDDVRVADPLLFDREVDAECRRDDELRCVPVTTAAVEAFFADSTCATPIDLAIVPVGECDPRLRHARKGDDIHTLGARYPHTIYWLSTGDTCGIYAPPPSYEAWTVEAAIDLSAFPAARVTIDP